MKKGRILTILGLLLIAAAFGLTGYNLYDNYRAGETAADVLSELTAMVNPDPIPPEGRILYEGEPIKEKEEQSADASVTPDESESAESVPEPEDDEPYDVYGLSGFTPEELANDVEIEYPDYILNPEMGMPVQSVGGNDYVGILTIPTLGLNLPIFNEWNYDNLKTAPCRYSGDAYQDDMVICGHDYRSHFGPITRLRYGDSVTFTDMDGNVFTYAVREVNTLLPTAVEEMTDSGWALTLFTCNIGGTARITVRCEKTE